MTISGIACPEPGCDGMIEDGCCDATRLVDRSPPSPDPNGPGGGTPGSGFPDGAGTTRVAGATRVLVGSGPAGGSAGLGPAARPPAAGGATGGASNTGSEGASGSVTTAGGTRRSRRTGRSRRPANRLGVGLVDLPELPAPDPESLLLVDPCVPETRRFCSACRAEVGRSLGGGEPGAREGRCAGCGHAFSFVPSLRAGDRIGVYEIAGALAHGGQGWVYLARDRGVAENFWVVLKGLLDKDDPQAQAAAMDERRFLASVDHPGIVRIHTFVKHADTGYIVMEYIGGTSLRNVLRARAAAAGRPDPLPVPQAIAYILAVLPAFAYLHRKGLLFCDFKPDNVMLGREALRLIDLGGVRHLDATDGPLYSTPGYAAPELNDEGPSVSSDLYTVGRTLATLILNFRGNTTTYAWRLPPQTEHPVLLHNESLYRFLCRAAAPAAAERFESADEMHDELLGVLRQIVAAERGAPVPAPSRRFTGDVHLTGDGHLDSGTLPATGGRRPGPVAPAPWDVLPRLRVDPEDPAAGTLTALPDGPPAQLAALLGAMRPATVEVRLRLARARLELGEHTAAAAALEDVRAEDEFDWRADWYGGQLALVTGDTTAARTAFTHVYAQLPGELAPQLALALTAEAAGDLERAAALFDRVSRTDDTFTSAAFGLARVRVAAGDRSGALDALRRVPATSAAYREAQIRLVLTLGTVTAAGIPTAADLRAATELLRAVDLDRRRRAALTRDLLRCTLELVLTGQLGADPGVLVDGVRLEEVELRRGLERAYRELARVAASATERYQLVDLANDIRPRTLI